MKPKQILAVTRYNFRRWHKNPRIAITFCLAFVLCFLLSDKAVKFAKEYETTMQLVEAFVWTFGDSNSILLSSLLLLLLFADMPFISSATPFYLMRIDRKTWLTGQAAYIALATLIYLAFILVSTSLVCMRQSFIGDMWSETAAILGYSGAGQKVALPALVKTLEMSRPYECMATIFLLMLLYTLLMVFVMLLFNLRRGQLAGIAAVFAFSLFGFLLNPAGCAHVQGQRGGRLAFAAESGHVSHAQLRLRPAAKALADVFYIRNAHRPVLFTFPSGGAELQL